MRIWILIVLVFGVSNCVPRASDKPVTFNSTHETTLTRSGHWSVGPAYSWFTLAGTNKRYWLDGDGLPEDVRNRLHAQPLHPTFSDGPEVSLHMVVDAYITSAPHISGLEQIHIQRVISTSAPEKEFVKGRNNSEKNKSNKS